MGESLKPCVTLSGDGTKIDLSGLIFFLRRWVAIIFKGIENERKKQWIAGWVWDWAGLQLLPYRLSAELDFPERLLIQAGDRSRSSYILNGHYLTAP